MKYKEQFDEMLNECYGEIRIGEITFSPSKVLEELDPIAYGCAYNDWTDSEGLEED